MYDIFGKYGAIRQIRVYVFCSYHFYYIWLYYIVKYLNNISNVLMKKNFSYYNNGYKRE